MENIIEVALRMLELTPARWTSLAETYPAELLAQRPAAGEWSALECLAHLVDTERNVLPGRLSAILAGAAFPNYAPAQDDSAPKTAVELAAQFADLRRASLEQIRALTPADLAKHGLHPKHGAVTLSELLHHWAGHDLNHTVQAERALLQPFIQGCGPWRSGFADHIITEKAA